VFHLLTGTYVSSHPARYAELLDCLERNLANPEIECVHAFAEDSGVCYPNERHVALLKHPKAKLIEVGHRMTYREYFQYANARLRDQCCVMANSDIYFDSSLAKIKPELLSKYFFACSRSHVRADGTVEFDPQASCAQDAWFFRPPVKIPTDCDFHFGLPGCDNKIVYLMATQSGLKVVNPSRTIALFHHHASNIAGYGPQVPGPHWNVAPQELPTE
jgi:hypothetical protein